jgi:NitT/TauT family transport system substrate-binding protein
MRWQLNEINALIWPSPLGIGVMDETLYQQTVQISQDFGVIQNAPDDAALRTDLAQQALEGLTDLDTTGESYVLSCRSDSRLRWTTRRWRRI